MQDELLSRKKEEKMGFEIEVRDKICASCKSCRKD